MEQIFSSLNQNGTSTHSTNVNFSTSKGNGQLLESYVKGKDCDFTGHKRGSSAVQTDLTVPKLSGSSGTVLQTVTSNRQLEGFHSENIQNSINVIQKEATSLAFNNPSTDLGDKKFPFKYLCQLPSLNSLVSCCLSLVFDIRNLVCWKTLEELDDKLYLICIL